MVTEYREHELEDLRAMRDRLLNTIGWYTGTAEIGGPVEPDAVVQRLRWVLDGTEEHSPAGCMRK